MWKRSILWSLNDTVCGLTCATGAGKRGRRIGENVKWRKSPFPLSPVPLSFSFPPLPLSNGGYFNHLERFSYDVEMKTRKQNRNNKRTEIERFDWFIQRIQKHVAFGWESVKGQPNGGRRKIINKLVIVVTKSAPDVLKPEWRLLVVVHVFAMNLWNAVFVFEFLGVILSFSFVFFQLLHFVSRVNENPHACHA